MDMKAKNQYLNTLITGAGGYHLKGRKQKSRILDEYCRITGQNREYVIRKIKCGAYVASLRKEKGEEKRKTRPSIYDGNVTGFLIKIWNIFDNPAGVRMKEQIVSELSRLQKFGEITISSEMEGKLKKISASEIDRSLATHKEKERIRIKYAHKIHPLLYQKIPAKIGKDQDRFTIGTIQIDTVEHCGQKAEGVFIYTLSTTDIATNWWQGGALLTKGMQGAVLLLDSLRKHYPFSWTEMHSDNGTEFINSHLYRYSVDEEIEFTRSRPYQKNDNFLVEQKNGRIVRRQIGYRRHDTLEEFAIMNELCELLSWYHNFFQPVQKLLKKERSGAKIKRTFDVPKTPYRRVMESEAIPDEMKRVLRTQYESLNPADLKRRIDKKRDELYRAYEAKSKRGSERKISKAEEIQEMISLTFLNDLTEVVSPT